LFFPLLLKNIEIIIIPLPIINRIVSIRSLKKIRDAKNPAGIFKLLNVEMIPELTRLIP